MVFGSKALSCVGDVKSINNIKEPTLVNPYTGSDSSRVKTLPAAAAHCNVCTHREAPGAIRDELKFLLGPDSSYSHDYADKLELLLWRFLQIEFKCSALADQAVILRGGPCTTLPS